MYIAYYDESGDDGYPRYSSPFFVLSALYLHYLDWQPIFEEVRALRRNLKQRFDLPVKTEVHTRPLLLNKKPYRSLGLLPHERVAIISAFARLIGRLPLKVVNVVIVKPRIRKPDYQVLDTALTYSIQRIENDLAPDQNPDVKFMMITDPGRMGKMRKTARRMRRINFIPSKFGPGSYRREIQTLIEDPLPKDSRESYFIQMADTISFIVYLHTAYTLKLAHVSNRLAAIVSPTQIALWMDMLKGSFNLQASRKDAYGIVYHPR